jgi:hypothetical protein
MALLSASEKAALKEQGLYLKEKCDECNKPIMTEYTFIGKDKLTRCQECQDKRKGRTSTAGGSILEEADKVAAKTKEKAEKKEKGGAPKTVKIFGVILPGTAIADLALFLQDEKKHSIKDTLKAINPKHKADKMGRLKQLARYGKQKGGWSVTIDGEAEMVQLKMGKAAAQAVEAKAEKKAEKKETSKKNGKEEEPDDEVSGKQQQSIQKLLRKTLKGKDDWKKNALIEHIAETHDLEPKRVQAALQAEIKSGGITDEKGVMGLV